MPTSCRSTPTSAAGAYPGINPFRREKPAKPQAPPPLRAEALALPVPVIVEEQLDEWRVAFDELDLDGDGRLSGRELQCAIYELDHCSSLQPEQIAEMVRGRTRLVLALRDVQHMEAQKGNSRQPSQRNSWKGMDFSDFVTVLSSQQQRELYLSFQLFDQDCDGYVTPDDLVRQMKAMGTRLTKPEARQMIAEGDVRLRGKLNFAEFSAMMLGD